MKTKNIVKVEDVKSYNRDGVEYYPFILTDETLDADFERVSIAGIDTERFLKNPVALFQHESWSLPIGEWVNVSKDLSNRSLKADLKLNVIDPEQARIKRYLDAGLIKGASIGFRSFETEMETPDDETKEKLKNHWKSYIVKHTKTELIEASIVSLPSNPNALIQKSMEAFKSGSINKEDFEKLNTIAVNKSGAVLSKSNYEKLQSAVSMIQEVLDNAEKEKDLIDELNKLFNGGNDE